MKKYNVAVVGVTGVIGQAFLDILAERHFPIYSFYPLASEHSVGKTIRFANQSYKVGDVAAFDFSQADFVFFSAGAAVSAEFVPWAVEAGCIVIDNTSYFRYQDEVPLIIPEVNAEALLGFGEQRIIANPNCSTIQMLVALTPIYDAVGIERINVATYQAVSGAGRRSIDELANQTAALLNGKDPVISYFPKQIAFNVLPQIDAFQDNGYTREEMKMVWETQKILDDYEIKVNPTAVRVPVFYGHSEALHIETKDPITPNDVIDLLSKAPGVVVVGDQDYPTAITHAAAQDEVFVGRIRKDLSHPHGIDLWVVADNVRKGGALNAVQIAELLIRDNEFVH